MCAKNSKFRIQNEGYLLIDITMILNLMMWDFCTTTFHFMRSYTRCVDHFVASEQISSNKT